MPACGAGDADAHIGLGLREVQPLSTVGEHRRGGFTGVEPASLDLADVGDEVGLDAARVRDELVEAAQQLVVGEAVEMAWGCMNPI